MTPLPQNNAASAPPEDPSCWAEAMRLRLSQRLQTTQVEVQDQSGLHAGHAGANASGYGTHFKVRIAAAGFAGLTRLARHRLVYDALQDFLDRGVHALAIELI